MLNKISQCAFGVSTNGDGHTGRINTAKHHIELLTLFIRLLLSALCRACLKTKMFEKAGIDNVLNYYIIKPALAEWALSVVYAPKKYGNPIFCSDYQKSNAVAKHDSYPVPLMDECFDALDTFTVFSALDGNIVYWQIKFDEADYENTTFTSHHELFQFFECCSDSGTHREVLSAQCT